MDCDNEELQATKKLKKEKNKCEYCEKEKKMEERKNDCIYITIYGKFLRLQGKLFTIPFGRAIAINYCPMCGRRL